MRPYLWGITKCPCLGGIGWGKKLEGHSTCEGKASNKNSLRIENVRSHGMKKRIMNILVQNELMCFVMVEVLLCFALR